MHASCLGTPFCCCCCYCCLPACPRGWLSSPAVQYPGTFSKDGIFGRHPFALPSLVSAGLSIIGFIMAAFVLQESLDPKFRSECTRVGPHGY
jgi:hypothetical protein